MSDEVLVEVGGDSGMIHQPMLQAESGSGSKSAKPGQELLASLAPAAAANLIAAQAA